MLLKNVFIFIFLYFKVNVVVLWRFTKCAINSIEIVPNIYTVYIYFLIDLMHITDEFRSGPFNLLMLFAHGLCTSGCMARFPL